MQREYFNITESILNNFKYCLLLNEMIFIKSFLTDALYDRSKLVYGHSNEGDKKFPNVTAI